MFLHCTVFELITFIGGLLFNLGFLIYDIWFTKKVNELSLELCTVYKLTNQSVDDGEEHYDSLCHHIQNNREIELDIYEEVKR